MANDVLTALPRDFVTRHQVFPFAWEQGRLSVAIADPLDVALLDSLAHIAGRPVMNWVATGNDIKEAIARHYESSRLIAQLEVVSGAAAANGQSFGGSKP